MKKIYEVINNKYVVDKEAKIVHKGDWVVETHNPIVLSTCEVSADWDLSQGGYKDKLLIATIGEANRIGNLPVIEFEENVDELALDSVGSTIYLDTSKEAAFIVGFRRGYKVAQSKGCWTDEHIQKLSSIAQGLDAMAYELNDGTISSYSKELLEFVQSNKQPDNITEVELEVEICCEGLEQEGKCYLKPRYPECGCQTRLKITKTTDKGNVIIIPKLNL